MHYLLDSAHYMLSFAIVISVVVAIHEFGHYLVARLCGVKIEEFSIGFGPEILGYTSRSSGTRWKLALLPLGGYVRMYGDASAASNADVDALEALSPEERKKTFHFKSLPAKAAVVAAGPAANFILTIALFTGFILTTGLPSSEPIVGSVLAKSPAAEAGLQAGDRITKVGDTSIKRFSEIPYLISTNLGTPVTVEFLRDKKPHSVTITPREEEDTDALGTKIKHPLIGIKSAEIRYEKADLTKALAEASYRTWQLCTSTLTVLGQIISGQRSPTELKGPIGIAQLSGAATDKGISTTLWLIAVISANLGFVNLLPIPVLDGGHLLFYAAEASRGRPLAKKVQEYGFRAGLALIIMLMGFTILNDMRQWLF